MRALLDGPGSSSKKDSAAHLHVRVNARRTYFQSCSVEAFSSSFHKLVPPVNPLTTYLDLILDLPGGDDFYALSSENNLALAS